MRTLTGLGATDLRQSAPSFREMPTNVKVDCSGEATTRQLSVNLGVGM